MSGIPLIIWIVLLVIVGLAIIIYQLSIQRQLSNIEAVCGEVRVLAARVKTIEIELQAINQRLGDIKTNSTLAAMKKKEHTGR